MLYSIPLGIYLTKKVFDDFEKRELATTCANTIYFHMLAGILLIIGFLLLIIIIIKKSGPKMKVRKGNTLSSRTINVISADTLAELMKNKNI